MWPILVAASIIAATDTSETVPDMLKNPSLFAGVMTSPGIMTCPQTVILSNKKECMAHEQR